MVTAMVGPWFSGWNYVLLKALFCSIPHSPNTDDWFGLLITYPFLGTWFFAVCFYLVWARDDEGQARRRSYLLRTVLAVGAAFLFTAVIRPWIRWPAPVLNPTFQTLFPRYLWGNDNTNCFPSHSTLAYFTVTMGFWPLKRGLSVLLSLLVLALVSMPRMYLGGHYPIDIVFSCALSLCALICVWQWHLPNRVSEWLIRRGSGTTVRDCLFFLWTFELGEGFRGAEFVSGAVHRLFRS
jgi:membrane-associated phospholipid phosphatase